MGINRFFEDTLGAKLNNPRQSWGAINPDSNCVFLTVLEDQIEPDGSGERAKIYNKKSVSNSQGYPERYKHIEAIRKGAECFGVVIIARAPLTIPSREIDDFDTSTLLQLGGLTEDANYIYAHIVACIPTSTL